MKQQNQKKFSNKPYIGTKDYYGTNLDLLFYIFNKWRKLAQSYNYQEYINPILEYANLYKAKSGEDLGNKELYEFYDKGNRQVAIRPEATPSITRIVSSFYNNVQKPIRMFSIQNFMRYEKPQKGRYREFWQFNIDMFGNDSINSDLEILKIAAESILIFRPPKNSFVIYLNSRPLMDFLFTKTIEISDKFIKQKIQKLIDKYTKLSKKEFKKELENIGLNKQQIKNVFFILESDITDLPKINTEIENESSYKRVSQLLRNLKTLGLNQYFKFNSAIVRGIDYYDGIVFEAFDLNPENNRAMFGGGRYNGLGHLFGIKNMPAIGFAPGNATMELFLKDWGLIPQNIKPTISFYLPQIEKNKTIEYYKLRDKLLKLLKNKVKNDQNKMVAIEVSLKSLNLNQALKYALSKNFDYLIIYGEKEEQENCIILKELISKKQTKIKLN